MRLIDQLDQNLKTTNFNDLFEIDFFLETKLRELDQEPSVYSLVGSTGEPFLFMNFNPRQSFVRSPKSKLTKVENGTNKGETDATQTTTHPYVPGTSWKGR